MTAVRLDVPGLDPADLPLLARILDRTARNALPPAAAVLAALAATARAGGPLTLLAPGDLTPAATAVGAALETERADRGPALEPLVHLLAALHHRIRHP